MFFDRDGTLIKDSGFVSRPDQVELLTDVGGIISGLNQSNILCCVVTNQSGVGRGFMAYADVMAVNQRLDYVLWEDAQASIQHYFICPHHPEERCVCRKPRPYMLEQACMLYGLDPRRCWMIGDKLSDTEAGRNMGMQTCLIGEQDDQATRSGISLLEWYKGLEM